MRSALVVFWLLLPASAGASGAVIGDVNGDGRLDGADVMLLQRVVGGLIPASAVPPDQADVAPVGAGGLPGDGRVDVADLLLMMRAVGGQDVDADGVGAAEEAAAGTSPFSSDTDGDLVPDAVEIALGTPAAGDADGDGFLDGFDPEPRVANAVVGSVLGWVRSTSRCDDLSLEPMAHLEVEIAGGGTAVTVLTDARGRFALPAGAPASGSYQARLRGPRLDLMRNEMLEAASGAVHAGVPLRIVLDDSNSSLSARMTYYHAVRAYDFFRRIAPGDASLDPAVVFRIRLWSAVWIGPQPNTTSGVTEVFDQLLVPLPTGVLHHPDATICTNPLCNSGPAITVYEFPEPYWSSQAVDIIGHEYGHWIQGRLSPLGMPPEGGGSYVSEQDASIFAGLLSGKDDYWGDAYPADPQIPGDRGCRFKPALLAAPGTTPPNPLPPDYRMPGTFRWDERWTYDTTRSEAQQTGTALLSLFGALRSALRERYGDRTPGDGDPRFDRAYGFADERLATLWYWMHRLLEPPAAGGSTYVRYVRALFAAAEVAFGDGDLATRPAGSEEEALWQILCAKATDHILPSFACPVSHAVLDADADGDGLSNGRELAQGGNPAAPSVWGTVRAVVADRKLCASQAPEGLEGVRVEILNGTAPIGVAYSDAQGRFFFDTTPSATLSYRAGLLGRAAHVIKDSGSLGEFAFETGPLTPGVGANVLLSVDADPGLAVAAATAYQRVTQALSLVRGIDPGFGGVAEPLAVRLTPPSVSGTPEFRSSRDTGGAPYARFPSVSFLGGLVPSGRLTSAVEHEYGHALTDALFPDGPVSADGDQLHEGWASAFALLAMDAGPSEAGALLCNAGYANASSATQHPAGAPLPPTDARNWELVSRATYDVLQALRTRYPASLPGNEHAARDVLLRIWHEGRKRTLEYPPSFAALMQTLFAGDEALFGDGDLRTESRHRDLLCPAIQARFAAAGDFVCPPDAP